MTSETLNCGRCDILESIHARVIELEGAYNLQHTASVNHRTSTLPSYTIEPYAPNAIAYLALQ